MDCIQKDILKEYLEKTGSEVSNMLLEEFDIEIAKEVWMEEGQEMALLEVAKVMLSEGMSIKSICKMTKLSEDVVQKLISAS